MSGSSAGRAKSLPPSRALRTRPNVSNKKVCRCLLAPSPGPCLKVEDQDGHTIVPNPKYSSRRITLVESPGFHQVNAEKDFASSVLLNLSVWLRRSWVYSLGWFMGDPEIIGNSKGTKLVQIYRHHLPARCIPNTHCWDATKCHYRNDASFIRMKVDTAVGEDVEDVADDLVACTKQVTKYQVNCFSKSGCRVFLVDVPGFNDSSADSNAETLNLIKFLLIILKSLTSTLSENCSCTAPGRRKDAGGSANYIIMQSYVIGTAIAADDASIASGTLLDYSPESGPCNSFWTWVCFKACR
ncbi:hypothetical protein BJ138DRAFT_1143637 [Hygrophoropsis aurantiaca]|uniref:Uncharacterized protein n=1 Tax=Hygrophoropsis aurantiaca TaxID=72124 RepID=A0ACB8AM38_9AGAM|nr:hypothetical protein BJ138DRAFT_1143637 [Hygrophoropsis aurantiaca]